MATESFPALLERRRGDVEALLSMEPDDKRRFIALAVNAVSKPDFTHCTPESKLQCILDAATCELELGTPDRLAFLVPYKAQLTFSPSYVGMTKRLIEAGAAADLYADLVYANDSIEIISGSERKLVHKPKMFGDRGHLIGAYAIAKLTNGLTTWEILELGDIAAIKAAALRVSQGKESPAWRFFQGEMVKKSAIRRLAKRLPGRRDDQDKVSRLQAALVADNRHFDFEAQSRTVDAGGTTLDEVADTLVADEPAVNGAPKEPEPPPPPPDPYLDLREQTDLESMCIMLGFRARDIAAVIQQVANVDSTDLIRKSQLDGIISQLQERARARTAT